MSQLDLALAADVSSRHVSFLETARARPSEEMVLRLGAALELTFRDQNALLSTSPYGRPAIEQHWRPWHWMRDSDDPRVRFLWQRMIVSKPPDC